MRESHEHCIAIGMSRRGNPYDNATCESFLKTLKDGEVYRQEYRDLGEVLYSTGALSSAFETKGICTQR